MRTDKLQTGFRAALLCALALAPATAFAHAYVMQPPPRDVGQPDLNARAHKTGPCGGVPRTGKPTQYDAGATITVKFEETVAHQGCYQIAFSPANDTNFTTLAQMNDPAGMLGTPITTTVTLPAGVTCPACTLVVRQLMQGTTCPANADPAVSAQGTYYSCADICVGTVCTQPDAGVPPTDGGADGGTPGTDGGGSSGSSGSSGSTADGGDEVPPGSGSSGTRPPNLRNGEGDGCSVKVGATSGVSFVVTAGLLGLALLRRRRKK